MVGIYELSRWFGLTCYDMRIKFHKDWFTYWTTDRVDYTDTDSWRSHNLTWCLVYKIETCRTSNIVATHNLRPRRDYPPRTSNEKNGLLPLKPENYIFNFRWKEVIEYYKSEGWGLSLLSGLVPWYTRVKIHVPIRYAYFEVSSIASLVSASFSVRKIYCTDCTALCGRKPWLLVTR
jgi:hypothetical protein